MVSLAEAKFIDSSVIHALFDADARLVGVGRRLVLHVGTAPPVKRVLELCGLPTALPFFASIDEAIEQARRIGGRT